MEEYSPIEELIGVETYEVQNLQIPNKALMDDMSCGTFLQLKRKADRRDEWGSCYQHAQRETIRLMEICASDT